MRERYKQADLEGWALRQVYRAAESYLITLSAKEANNVKDKIAHGEIMGIKSCVVAAQPEYDDLLASLQQRSFCAVSPVIPCKGKLFAAC